MDLKDRVALVTGSAHRLGRHLALALAERGAHLVIHYHQSAAEAQQTAAEAAARGIQVATLQADLRSMEAIRGLFRQVDERFGGLDILVNSAAVMHAEAFLDIDEEAWARTMDLNLRATFFCTQEAARRMRARGGGAVVNITDVAGLRPWVRYPLLSISKAGVEMLTRVAARALAPKVRVNAVAPGPILPAEGTPEAQWQRLLSALPAGRQGTPYEVAQAMLFLLENDYITGETLVVDGGRTLV